MDRDLSKSAWFLVLALGCAGCAAPGGGSVEARRCLLVASFRPDKLVADKESGVTREQADHPELIGSWDGWQRPGLRVWDHQQGPGGVDWRILSLPLPQGVYHYGILVGGKLFTDDRNPQSAFVSDPLSIGADPLGTEVSRTVIPDCRLPTLTVASATPAPAPAGGGAQGGLTVLADFTPGTGGQPLDPRTLRATLHRGSETLPAPRLEVAEGAQGTAGTQRITARAAGLPPGKYTVTILGADTDGGQAGPAVASAFVEHGGGQAAPRGLFDGLVYQLVIDRFRGPGPLPQPKTPGDRAGGTLQGVHEALQAGYFERLGVTTLWLSPVYRNPPGRFTGRDGHLYQAYHGYWPSAPREVEPQIGGEAALDALLALAHARGIRIIVDAVPHHVHDSHPYYRQHSRLAPLSPGDPRLQSWFSDGPSACVCGNPGCSWGERIEDCWFDTYLPSLNWRHPEVLDTGTGDLLWWMSRFDLDGLRIDAVPMMPRAATRRVVRAAREAVHRDGLDQLLLGETYTGPGDAGRAEIRAFLGKSFDGLDSEFDFPLMWAMRTVIAHGGDGFDKLEKEIDAGNQAWAGSGAVIAHIAGNHDTTRFLSEAAGDAGGDPWTAPPPQPTGAEPYKRHLLGMTLLLTLPGLPVLYYGDEVGLAGATDPDSRRSLPDVLSPSLPPMQAQMLLQISRLGRLRACLPALRRGTRRALFADAHHDVAVHDPPAQEVQAGGQADPAGDAAIVVLSRDPAEARVVVPGLPQGSYRDVLSPGRLSIGPGLTQTTLTLPPLSVAVYIRDGHPCLE